MTPDRPYRNLPAGVAERALDAAHRVSGLIGPGMDDLREALRAAREAEKVTAGKCLDAHEDATLCREDVPSWVGISAAIRAAGFDVEEDDA